MQAVILAGGQGTRLRPYTAVLPKPLMPIGDLPILEIVLRQLRRAGFAEVTLAVSYLAEMIQAYCGDGSRYGLRLRYSRETAALSTAGPLQLVPGLDGTFLVMNGDLLTTLDYGALVRRHRESGAVATIATHRRSVRIDYGVVEPGADGTLARYVEKPEYHYQVSMGINVLEPRVLEHIRPGEPLGNRAVARAVVDDGAIDGDVGVTNSGSAYLFQVIDQGTADPYDDRWSMTAEVAASHAATSDARAGCSRCAWAMARAYSRSVKNLSSSQAASGYLVPA